MHIFNKVLVIIILLLVAVVSMVAIINEFVGFFVWSEVALRVFNPQVSINPFISSLALLFVLAVSIFLLLLEFYKKKPKVACVYKVKEGNAMITLESVAKQIKSSIEVLEGVQDTHIRVQPQSKGIINSIAVNLSEDVDLPQKMQEIIHVAKDIATNKLGIRIIKTNLTVINLAEAPQKKAEEPQKDTEKTEQALQPVQEETAEQPEETSQPSQEEIVQDTEEDQQKDASAQETEEDKSQ